MITQHAPALLGGALIGLSAGLFLLGSGRIAGISGIFGDMLTLSPDRLRAAFFAGLIAAPWLLSLTGFAALPGGSLETRSWLVLGSAGLLVGAGTAIGNGCTSGHGVCGLANFSGRGLVSTLTFMGVAMVVVALLPGVFA